MKDHMNKIKIILIILGILIMLVPAVGGLCAEYQENRMMDEWLQSSTLEPAYAPELGADPEEEFMQLQESFENENQTETDESPGVQTPVQPSMMPSVQPERHENPQTIDTSEAAVNSEQLIPKPTPSHTPTPKPTPKATPKPEVKQEILGVIVIDKIKLKYPIVEGVKKENLKAGIGHIPGTAGLGQQGNCALAGHRYYTFGNFFNRLDELQEGDVITVSNKKGDYSYVVYEKLVVTPDDVSVLKRKDDESILTLVTCTPLYVGTHRLIVHARLENKTETVPQE